MKAYLVEISEYTVDGTDGTKKDVAIYTHDDREMAVSNFHKKMGGAMGNSKYTSELLLVVMEDGSVVKNEKFVRGVVPNEPIE